MPKIRPPQGTLASAWLRGGADHLAWPDVQRFDDEDHLDRMLRSSDFKRVNVRRGSTRPHIA